MWSFFDAISPTIVRYVFILTHRVQLDSNILCSGIRNMRENIGEPE